MGHTRRGPFSQRSSGRRNKFRHKGHQTHSSFKMGSCSCHIFLCKKHSRIKHCLPFYIIHRLLLDILQPPPCLQQQAQVPTQPPPQPLTLSSPHPKPSTSSPLSTPCSPASSFPQTMATSSPLHLPPKPTPTTTTRAPSHQKTWQQRHPVSQPKSRKRGMQ